MCDGGPHDGLTYTYPEPLPETVLLLDAVLRYHEYRHISGTVYRKLVGNQWAHRLTVYTYIGSPGYLDVPITLEASVDPDAGPAGSPHTRVSQAGDG